MFNQMIIQGKNLEQDKKKREQNAAVSKTNGKLASKSAMTGKRRDLPVGQRRILEEQQKSVIAAYRLMKAKKEKALSTAS